MIKQAWKSEVGNLEWILNAFPVQPMCAKEHSPPSCLPRTLLEITFRKD